MKKLKLKRENFETEIDYLLVLVKRHRELCDDHAILAWENALLIRAFLNESTPPVDKYSIAEVNIFLKAKYGEPHLN
ncbi:MAG: hypothetical protein ABI675_21825 [Chitinophagaceae bacterium]